MKKRTYQFQLRLGVHRQPPAAPVEPETTTHGSALRLIIRDVLQQPLDFSSSKPDITYHLKPREPYRSSQKTERP